MEAGERKTSVKEQDFHSFFDFEEQKTSNVDGGSGTSFGFAPLSEETGSSGPKKEKTLIDEFDPMVAAATTPGTTQ